LNKPKKIISIVIKSLIGILSVAVVYQRLKSDFNSQNLNILYDSVFSVSGGLSVFVCLLFIPLNWGLESWKWKMITAPVEKISFRTAQRSVYAGICLGNLAPGRATEFLAKIIFFKNENRPNITVLHFVNGMFQLCVTYLIGFIALAFKFRSFAAGYAWIAYLTSAVALLVIVLFVLSLVKIDKVLHFVSRNILKKHDLSDFKYEFTRPLLIKLFGLSLIRYIVFFIQLMLLVNLFSAGAFSFSIGLSIALYFLITTTIPMISVIEPAIRAAVALVVFRDTGVSNTALTMASVSIWMINIIVPSIAGYFILLEQNFDFYFTKAKK
jgi:hypothetical protein